MKQLCLSLFFLFLSLHVKATVWVYDYPDTLAYSQNLGRNLRSSVFSVKVKQAGQEFDSYVLADYNTFADGQRNKMTDWNHSTTFSFDGTVVIEIRKKDGSSLSGSEVFPRQLSVPFALTDNGNALEITLDQPRMLYVEVPGMFDHPLFIFADPAEVNVPDPNGSGVELITPGMSAAAVRSAIQNTSASVIYFAEGVHQYGEQTGNDYPGYQLPLLSNKTYYLPGGAYVVGSFRGDKASNVSVRGRGIISGCGKERLANAASIPFNLIMLDGAASGQVIEGITMTNPPHFCILSRGQSNTERVKLFGWWHQTDGWGSESGSKIMDSFMKVNDDYVKLYRANQTVTNIVMYKQINGAAIQLGWNQYGQASNGLVKDIYVVADADKAPAGAGNTAVINLRNNDGSAITNLVMENIYLEADVQRTLGIETTGGSVTNVIIRNVFLTGQNRSFNYLYGNGGGTISGITLENIQINGECVENDQDFALQRQGTVNSVSYQSCNTTDLEPEAFSTLITSVEDGVLWISDASNTSQRVSLEIIDLQGRRLYHRHEIRLPVKWKAPTEGVYFLRLSQNGDSLTRKMLIR